MQVARKKPVRIWVFSLLFWLVGLSSWITITGLFAELSLIEKGLSGGFEIWSVITLIIQSANIGPLIYAIIPRPYKTQRFVVFNGYAIFTFSFLSMITMSLFWDTEYFMFGSKRALVLYLTTFGTSMCDCMTSIIFWVFVSYFPTQYMAILGAGECSSGIICAILIYIQQLNREEDNPRFSVEVYLLILALLLPVSAMSFTLLMRFLQNGYFENAKDWISSTTKITHTTDITTRTATASNSNSNSIETQTTGTANNTLNNSQNTFYQSLSKHDPTTPDPIETEMVQSKSNISSFTTKLNQSNISSFTNKLNQNYSSMKSTEALITETETETEFNIGSTITLNTNQINIIKDHFAQNQLRGSFKSALMGVASEASTGVTQNINAIILKNVHIGYWNWIILIAVLSGVQNGMIPAIASFSLLPYDDIAYIYSVTISNIFTPFSALLPVLLPTYLLNARFIFLSSGGWISASIYILLIALQSPHPFGVNNNNGGQSKQFWRVIIVVVSVACAQLLTLCKTCIYLSIKMSFMRKAHFLDHDTLEKGLSRMMEIVGRAVQVGSFFGAVTFFVLVNFFHIFRQ